MHDWGLSSRLLSLGLEKTAVLGDFWSQMTKTLPDPKHQQLLELVYARFREAGVWPNARKLRVDVRQIGDLVDLCREIGVNLIVTGSGNEAAEKTELRVGALEYLSEAEDDKQAIAGAIKVFVKQFVANGGEASVTAVALAEALGLDDNALRRLLEWLQFAPLVLRNTMTKDTAGIVGFDILKLEGVESFEGYLARVEESNAKVRESFSSQQAAHLFKTASGAETPSKVPTERHAPTKRDSRSNKKPTFKTAFTTYKTGDVIGEGGCGFVYAVEDEEGKPWAAKVLNPAKATREKLKRFKNEYYFSRRNQHAHIVTVVDHGVTELRGQEAPFFVMPRYKGSLRDLLKQGIPSEKVLPYFSQMLDGVEAAHILNVVHRDLKPENVLIDQAHDHLVVADFGIASFDADDLYTEVETAPNTRLHNTMYAAPEQRVRGGPVDRRADIHTLGLMLNEMFTGKVPYGTAYKTIASVNGSLGYLDDLVAKMMCQEPADRPSTIDVVKRELIARGQAYVDRQRLSEIQAQVIKTTESDDPLISDPPRLVAVRWVNGTLHLQLSREVNQTWVWALQNMGSYSAVWDKGPEVFRVAGDTAVVDARENDAQQIVDYFKGWLPQVNRVYAERVKSDLVRAEEEARERLRRQQEAAALQEKLNRSLHI